MEPTKTPKPPHPLSKEGIAATFAASDEENKKCRIKGKSIILQGKGGDYPVALDRCNTHEKIVWWLMQLSEKPWFTRPMMARFIHHACHYHKLPSRGPL